MSGNDDDSQHRSFWGKTCKDLRQRLIAYALRLANGRSYDADDLVQETVRRVLTYPKNPEEVENPYGYLLTIMRNIWSTKWRKEQTANTESFDEWRNKEAQQKPHRNVGPAVESDVLRNLEHKERMAQVRAELGPLTSREKKLFRLYLQNYSCKEIANILNEDVRLVRYELSALRTKIISRVKKALKKP